jgi:hypothetical protein
MASARATAARASSRVKATFAPAASAPRAGPRREVDVLAAAVLEITSPATILLRRLDVRARRPESQIIRVRRAGQHGHPVDVTASGPK